MYNIDWYLFRQQQLPKDKRKVKFLNWLRVFLSGIVYVYNAFRAYTAEIDAMGLYSSETIYLEKGLNDKFGTTTIFDGAMEDEVYVPSDEDNEAGLLLCSDEDVADIYFDEVYVPSDEDIIESVDAIVKTDVQQENWHKMRAFIDYYKPIGIFYKIENFEL